MIEAFGFMGSIDLENHFFKRDAHWLLNIYDSAETHADNKAKEVELIMTKNKKFEQSGLLTEEKEKLLEDFVHYKFHFKHLTLHSLFISAYSLLENHLQTIAKQLELYSIDRPKIKEINKYKSELDKIRKYLNIIHDIQTAKCDNTSWQLILKFQKIRNLIVHNGSTLNDTSKEICIRFLKKYETNFSQDYTFNISDRNFLADFCKVTSAYSDSIVTDIYKIGHFNW